MQTLYNCGPAKVPLPGELRAVEVVQRIKVGRQCEVACVIALWHVLCSVLPQQAAVTAGKRVTPLLCAADKDSL